MSFLEQVGGQFLTAEQVKNGDTAFTVSGFAVEQFPDGNRVVLRGKTGAGRETGLVLSARNGNKLRSFIRAAGVEEDALIGAKLTLTTIVVAFRGKMVDSIELANVHLSKAKPRK